MKRNTIFLIGLFVGLVIISLLVLQKPGELSSSSASTGFMYTIDSLLIDKIEIKTTNASVVLEKRGVEWFVAQPINYKADQSNVGNIINQVKNLEIKSIVSNKPEKHVIFQVDNAGTQLFLYEKNTEKAAFILGKMGPTYTESYARKINSDEVLLIQGAQSYMFNRQVKDWRDKTIFTTQKENLRQIQYRYGDTLFALTFQDSAWFVGKEKAQQSVVDGILNSLSNLQAEDFIDHAISPKVNATIGYSGVQIRFAFDKTNNKYNVQSSNSPQWFVVDQWKANQVLKRKKEIVEKSKN